MRLDGSEGRILWGRSCALLGKGEVDSDERSGQIGDDVKD